MTFFRSWMRRHADLDDEIASHMRMAIADRVARGESPEDAALAVRREFGSPALVKEVTRGMWTGAALARLVDEFRIAFRTLRRTPRFSVAAIACMAIGVGVTTTIFSALHSILLRPLPYPNADALVVINPVHAKGSTDATVTIRELDLWAHARTVSQLAPWSLVSEDLVGPESFAERVSAAGVSPRLFPLLGVRPLHGRSFVGADTIDGAPRVVILSHSLWQARFGSDTTVIGRTIQLGSSAVNVIGVMPDGFSFPEGTKLWEPVGVPRLSLDILFYDGVLARRRAGAPLETVVAEFAGFDRQLKAAGHYDQWTTVVRTLHGHLTNALRKPVFILQAAALLVLLTACANVAALMLARGAMRGAEMKVRSALGAAKRQLMGHILVECLAVAIAGAVIGTALAVAGLRLLTIAFPDGVPSYIDLSLHTPALLASLAVSTVAAIGFGLMPAVGAGRTSAISTSAAALGGARQTTSRRRLELLVAAELSLSVLLIAGASLLVTSNTRLEQSIGFAPSSLLSVRVPLPYSTYKTDAQRETFYRVFDERLARLPGVEAVTATMGPMPLDGAHDGMWGFRLASQPADRTIESQRVVMQYAGYDYLALLGVPLVAGRHLVAADSGGERAAVVNETFVRTWFSGRTMLGERIIAMVGGKVGKPIRIVGIVKDFRNQRPPAVIRPTVYLATPSGAPERTYILRTSLANPTVLGPSIRQIVHELDPLLVTYRLQAQTQVMRRAFWRERLQGRVVSVFALMAVLLAICGVYGVLSYTISQRTSELGIRLAVGASGGQILALMLRDAVRIGAIGAGAGLLIAIAGGRVISGVLYEVSGTNPWILVGAATALLLVAVAAAVVPARRASRLDPVTAIRIG